MSHIQPLEYSWYNHLRTLKYIDRHHKKSWSSGGSGLPATHGERDVHFLDADAAFGPPESESEELVLLSSLPSEDSVYSTPCFSAAPPSVGCGALAFRFAAFSRFSFSLFSQRICFIWVSLSLSRAFLLRRAVDSKSTGVFGLFKVNRIRRNGSYFAGLALLVAARIGVASGSCFLRVLVSSLKGCWLGSVTWVQSS